MNLLLGGDVAVAAPPVSGAPPAQQSCLAAQAPPLPLAPSWTRLRPPPPAQPRTFEIQDAEDSDPPVPAAPSDQAGGASLGSAAKPSMWKRPSSLLGGSAAAAPPAPAAAAPPPQRLSQWQRPRARGLDPEDMFESGPRWGAGSKRQKTSSSSGRGGGSSSSSYHHASDASTYLRLASAGMSARPAAAQLPPPLACSSSANSASVGANDAAAAAAATASGGLVGAGAWNLSSGKRPASALSVASGGGGGGSGNFPSAPGGAARFGAAGGAGNKASASAAAAAATAISHGPLSHLAFPPTDQPYTPARTVAVPVAFPASGGHQAYKYAMVSAVLEEVNLKLGESAQQLRNVLRRVAPPPPPQVPLHQQHGGGGRAAPQPPQHANPYLALAAGSVGRAQQQLHHQKQGGGGQQDSARQQFQQPQSVDGAALERGCQQAHVPYFASCELSSVTFRRREDEPGGAASTSKTVFYLTVPNARGRLKTFRRHDLWVLGSESTLSLPPPAAVFDRLRRPWLAVVRSLWHGPDRDGKMEVEFLTPPPPSLGKHTTVAALKGPDVASELSVLELLAKADFSALPLLPWLLRHSDGVQPPSPPSAAAGSAGRWGSGQAGAAGSSAGNEPLLQGQAVESSATAPAATIRGLKRQKKAAAAAAGDAAGGGARTDGGAAIGVAPADPTALVAAMADRYISTFKLNLDQALVIRHAASWLLPRGASASGGGKGSSGPGGAVQDGKTAGGARDDDAAVEGIQDGGAGECADGSGRSACLLPPKPPVLLCHGPFGSGKSTLLVALLMFVVEAVEALSGGARTARILLASNTNVAVDRLLTGLLDQGFSRFLRWGRRGGTERGSERGSWIGGTGTLPNADHLMYRTMCLGQRCVLCIFGRPGRREMDSSPAASPNEASTHGSLSLPFLNVLYKCLTRLRRRRRLGAAQDRLPAAHRQARPASLAARGRRQQG